MELNAAIVAMIIFVVYVVLTTAVWGMPDSISDTVYKFKRGWDVLFSAFIIGISVPVLLFTDHGPLYFVSGAFGFVLAVSPMFRGERSRIEPKLHVIGATGMIVALLAALWVHDGIWWTAVLGALAPVALRRPWFRRGTFWWKNKYGHLVEMDDVLISAIPVRFYTSWVEIAEAIICMVGLVVVAR